MWICFNDTFLSIVKKDCAADELLVRARRDGDIERVFPDAKVEVRFDTDYRCRAQVKRADVAAAIANRVMGIEYANFKDSVRNKKLHDAYMNVWHDMGRLQPGGPYSRTTVKSPPLPAYAGEPARLDAVGVGGVGYIGGL